MADLSVTLGADTTEFEKKVKSSGKTLEKELMKGGKGGGAMNAVNFAQNLMSGNVGAAVGSLFGPIGEAVGQFIDVLIAKANELIAKAKEFKLISMQTGLSTSKIQELEGISKASGISLGKLADSISEYNRRLGYARTHGGELNVLLNKLGVSFADIKNGTFDYFQAIEALRRAQAAGTEEAVLNHYAQVMLGSSYKEVLPLMKMGSETIKQQGNAIETASEESINALSKLKDYTEVFFINLGNAIMELLGRLAKRFQTDAAGAGEAIKSEYEKTGNTETAIEAGITKIGYGVTAAQRSNMMFDAIDNLITTGKISREVGKKLFDELDKRIPIDANAQKLTPLGSDIAQGASQMQQMAGGDLFGAVSFNPMQRVADNTDAINTNVAKIANQQTPTTDPQRDGLNR